MCTSEVHILLFAENINVPIFKIFFEGFFELAGKLSIKHSVVKGHYNCAEMSAGSVFYLANGDTCHLAGLSQYWISFVCSKHSDIGYCYRSVVKIVRRD